MSVMWSLCIIIIIVVVIDTVVVFLLLLLLCNGVISVVLDIPALCLPFLSATQRATLISLKTNTCTSRNFAWLPKLLSKFKDYRISHTTSNLYLLLPIFSILYHSSQRTSASICHCKWSQEKQRQIKK